MTERRFFVDPAAIGADRVELSDDLLRHISKVLRLADGDEVVLLDGGGGHFRCALEKPDGSAGSARILEQWHEPEKGLDIQLVQALPKGEKYDLILQKGTELGITRFTPVWSERSVPLFDVKRGAKKLQRWQRIVTEAARQSGRKILPACDPVRPLADVLGGCQQQLKLMLWEDGAQPLSDGLPEKRPESVALLVGPEGGFSRQEADIAQKAGFLPVTLGERILRTETAGFAVTAVLEYLYGDFGVGNNAVN
jgi:16S rRNA (uracil1498-N3)-methyltransferase